MSTSEDRLKIHCIGKHNFIWDPTDARRLREEFRIVGTLTGCLPRAPRQNAHLGLPLQLMYEEVTLLLEKGLADVVQEEYLEPTEEDIGLYKQQMVGSHLKQVELFREERRAEIRRKLPDIIEGKRKKRNALLEERKKNGEKIDDKQFEEEIVVDPESVEIPAIKEDRALIQLHTVCAYRRKVQRMIEWTYPQTDEEKLRYKVFKDFWEQNHYITSGSKFGGDFLVYPGDPSRFHSFFIAVCKPYEQSMTALDIVAVGRLGTSVKKTAVLCSEDESGNLCYTSLQWTGIS